MPEAPSPGHPQDAQKSRWMLASTGLNGALSVAKIGWGIYSGSTVVIADAVHSISDVLGALLIFAAIRFSRHRSPRFPYGLHKVEDMAALAGAVLVVLAAYEIVRAVFFTGGAQPPSNPVATMFFMAAIILAEGVFFLAERRAAQILRSPGLQSDVVNWLGDIGAGFVVIAGIGGHLLHLPYAQEIAVVIIVLLILEGAWDVLRDAVLSLLDASVPPEMLRRAETLLATAPEVEEVEQLRLRRAGSVLFADATIAVAESNFHRAHEVAERAEASLRQGFPELEAVTLHYEPQRKPYRRCAYLLDDDQATLAARFGATRWIRLDDQDRAGGAPMSRMVHSPVAGAERGKGIRLAAWLIAQGVDEIHLRSGEMEPALQDLLEAAGVAVMVDTQESPAPLEAAR